MVTWAKPEPLVVAKAPNPTPVMAPPLMVTLAVAEEAALEMAARKATDALMPPV
jgi:hypothetical protein